MLKKFDELHVINFLSALLIGIIIGFPHSLLRIALSLPFVLFSPGYALVAVLYPRRDDLSGAERIALSLGTSLAIVALVGLGLNFLPWGVRLMPILTSLAGFTAVCSVLAAHARGRLSHTTRFTVEIQPLLGHFHNVSVGQVAVAGITIAATVVVGWLLHAADSRAGETFTEFYVLNGSGKAEAFTDWVSAGKPAEIILGIINRESRRATYTVTIRAEGRPETILGPFSIEKGEKRERKVQVNLPIGTHREIQFLLFKDAGPVPYRRLRFWINAVPRHASGAQSTK